MPSSTASVQVDFDWRYRAPILPHLILLAAGGLADLLDGATPDDRRRPLSVQRRRRGSAPRPAGRRRPAAAGAGVGRRLSRFPARHSAKGSFFFVGEVARRHPELVAPSPPPATSWAAIPIPMSRSTGRTRRGSATTLRATSTPCARPAPGRSRAIAAPASRSTAETAGPMKCSPSSASLIRARCCRRQARSTADRNSGPRRA